MFLTIAEISFYGAVIAPLAVLVVGMARGKQLVELDMIPGDHTFSNIPEYDYVGTTEQHTPPFVRGQCGDGFVDGPSGQAIRRTTGLIRDVGPEPVACVPPPNPPPTVGSVYHKCMHDTMPTFYTPALADSWHEHSIYARPKRAPRG